MIEIELPLSPSLNHYYKRVGRRTILSEAGRKYRERVRQVLAALGSPKLDGRLSVEIEMFPPSDNRKRDLDNFDSKALFDALQHGGLYENDNQIKKRSSEWGDPIPGGAMIVRVSRC